MLTKPLNAVEGPVRIIPVVQHYEWGGTTVIPGLLGETNQGNKPFAELWIGAHPSHPSLVRRGTDRTGLDEIIARNPEEILGQETSRDHGGLPFLLKVLDAAKPLSIQVHPGEGQAKAGYAREESLGLSRSSPTRNYKDPHHKPELVVALGGDFWALRGFRPLEEIARLLRQHPELKELSDLYSPTSQGLKSLYEKFMTAPQGDVDRWLRPLLNRWAQENMRSPFPKEDARYWALKADSLFSAPDRTDRGVFSVLLLNLVKLRPGEALFLPAGVLHAYLEGTAMELMANSDNVLRGGLTPKHVDVPEVIKTVDFSGGEPEVLSPERVGNGECVYRTSAREFELSRMDLTPGDKFSSHPAWSGEILFVASGEVDLTVEGHNGDRREGFKRGDCLFVPRGHTCRWEAVSPTVVFRAGVPPVATYRGNRVSLLSFGTSGLRGLISDITDLEAYINTRGFSRYLLEKTGRNRNRVVSLGIDLRPSSPRIATAVAQALRDEGIEIEFMGKLPSPALMAYAYGQARASVMVTGSHIPFDRNGIKFNLPLGEVLKEDEPGILAKVKDVRSEEYNRPQEESPFDEKGFFKAGRENGLPEESSAARDAYVRRYLDFFPKDGLKGFQLAVYQHSAVGRDLLVDVLRGLGADVTAVGRSDTFVPIDTEDISDERLGDLERMVKSVCAGNKRIDALLSTDGDSDRPLVCGVGREGALTFIPGDCLGPLVAEYLDADGVVVPISGNDAVFEFLKGRVLPQTRIGSPFVISGMRKAGALKRVVGYEANGGFLIQHRIDRNGRSLPPLPTRDAFLPMLAVLFSAKDRRMTLGELYARLPRRFSKAGLMDNFPVQEGRSIIALISPSEGSAVDVEYDVTGPRAAKNAEGNPVEMGRSTVSMLLSLRTRVDSIFDSRFGFTGGLQRVNCMDGVRLWFGNGDVAHVRLSGNAPQLRIYACASTSVRAKEIVESGLREPDGLLRTLQKAAKAGCE